MKKFSKTRYQLCKNCSLVYKKCFWVTLTWWLIRRKTRFCLNIVMPQSKWKIRGNIRWISDNTSTDSLWKIKKVTRSQASDKKDLTMGFTSIFINLTPSQKINLLSTFERTDSWGHRIYYTFIKKLIIPFQMFTTNIHFLYLILSFFILNWLLFFIFWKIFI